MGVLVNQVSHASQPFVMMGLKNMTKKAFSSTQVPAESTLKKL